MITITLRREKGWSMPVKNKAGEKCDICGAKLWIAPHSGLYCDVVHGESETKKAEAASKK